MIVNKSKMHPNSLGYHLNTFMDIRDLNTLVTVQVKQHQIAYKMA